MPLLFTSVCDLLQSLENDLKRKRMPKGYDQIVRDWFAKYRDALDQPDTNKIALLSTLLPERRPDRVFNVKHKRLENIVGRAFGLGHGRKAKLRRWETEPGSGFDLADCVQEILLEAPNVAERDITVEEIDDTLHQLAAGVAFSSPSVRSSFLSSSSGPTGRKSEEALQELFKKLSPRDAKWLTRLVLKSFLPVIVPEYQVYFGCHRLLPTVLKIHADFTVAVRLLDQQRIGRRVLDAEFDKTDLPALIKPQVGVKVGRQTWLKARSIRHCLDLGRGLMSCETKMDGEYCQIHVDLSKGQECIQIFSKSGKDSTNDRAKLHGVLKSSLRIGTPSCKFQQRCILEGELVVYDHRTKRILGFEKIRKHVNRSGRFIGTKYDSQPHSWEQLMIVYYDILLIDDESMLNMRYLDRRRRLSNLISCQEGQSALARSQVINFSSRIAVAELREAFASSIVNREEGLVLKPDEPYFTFGHDKRKYASSIIKLKKGYVKNLGDIGDFAVVGARYDATRAKSLGMANIPYTQFYLGCLTNKEAATRFGATPHFKVVNEVELNSSMLSQFRSCLFSAAVSPEENDSFELELPPGVLKGKEFSKVFLDPPVFDVTCFSFHKEPNADFWSLRFPYVSKIHSDRSWKDCLGFDELQELAELDRKCPEGDDIQELATWIKSIEAADPKRRREREEEASQFTDSTDSISGSSQHSGVQSHNEDRTGVCDTKAAVGSGVMTPPTSSAAAQAIEQSTPQRPEVTERPRPKRRREGTHSSPRRTKPRGSEHSVAGSAVLSHGGQCRTRQPLEDITLVPSAKTNGLSPTAPQSSRQEKLHEEPEETQVSLLQPQPSASTPLNPLARGSVPAQPASRNHPSDPPTRCCHAGKTCALADYLVLLAPCVASMPLLTEDLLPRHGVAAVFTDTASWLASTAADISSGRMRRRMVLVERRRTEATWKFLFGLRAESPRGRDGEPIVVPAYDWRLLEDITDEEKTHKPSDGLGTRQKVGTRAHARELWCKHYVGLC